MKHLLFVAGLLLSATVHAQGYPNKPIKFVVPFPPGGNLDFVARNLQPKMQEVLGQPVLIDNKGGNAGMIGLEYASKQPGDGYTIVLGNTGTIAINQSVYPKMPYDAVKDFVADRHHHHQRAAGHHRRQRAGEQPEGVRRLREGQSRQAQLRDFRRGLRARTSARRCSSAPPASTSPSSSTRAAARWSPTCSAARCRSRWTRASVTMAQVKAGKLKAIAVTGKTRLASLPDVPTFEQGGFSVDASGFQGVLAPAGTPPEAVAKLSQALNAALAQPEVKEKFATAGLETVSSTPAEFAAFIRSEIAKWGRVAKEANIKIEQ